MAKTVVIVGGGWAGTAAALAARKTGCEVVLLERADMLLGTGLVGGIMMPTPVTKMFNFRDTNMLPYMMFRQLSPLSRKRCLQQE
ncbi:MAG: Glucose inhibited division protein [Anaerospora sp.]|nr:Glucose inhibited division protein [Anaerospora sp.]